MSARKAMLIDVTKCMGCRGCQVACKQWNQLPAEKTKFTGTYQNPPQLSGQTWTLIKFIEPDDWDLNPRWLFRKQQCLHCGDATCLNVCPTGAIKRKDGIVYIDQDVCTGCKYCVETCPFSTPHPNPDTGTAMKCRMCVERVNDGLSPACVTACPTGALSFGPREDMVALGEQRLSALRQTDPDARPRLYGKTELDGLGAMYVLPEAASIFGLPEDPKVPTARILLKWLLGVVPGLAILGAMWRYLRQDVSEAKTGGE